MGKTIEQIVLRDEYVKDLNDESLPQKEFRRRWGNFNNTYTDGDGKLRWVRSDNLVYTDGR